MTRGTCDNIGGYFVSGISNSSTSPATNVSTTTRTTLDVCYYDSFNCPGYAYRPQCYNDRSSTMSCPTCKNIGGMFAARYGCYFYSNNCRYLSAGGQCHTNR